MNIGIIGSGNVGSGLGDIWVKFGRHVLFSYSRDPTKLRAIAEAAGATARVGSPRQAVEFGEVILLAVPWASLEDALTSSGSLEGKILITTVNAIKPDLSELIYGTTTSAGEEIARKNPGAVVVEVMPVNSEILHSSSRQFGSLAPSVFYCGDQIEAKAKIALLLEQAGMEPVDVGPLKNARLIEPLALLIAQLAYRQGFGSAIALKLLRR